jgi:DNA-binding NtrC family response regulator
MPLTILIADDEQPARYGMTRALAKVEDCRIIEATNGREALEIIRTQAPDLVFLDLNMPEMGGAAVLQQLNADPAVNFAGEIIVVSANDTLESAVQCMRLGATDYLGKPFEIERLRAIAHRNLRRIRTEQRVSQLQTELDEKTAFGALLGISRPMRELFGQLPRAALAPLDILIRGETGTGKELIARELHRLSARHNGPFIALNSAAINEALAESQLFGHVKGAFTGAAANYQGVFEQADGGTLFLDEIGDMPPALQAKVLRALQERMIQPLGSSRNIVVDVRIISATHQDLGEAIRAGQFREDLYYRLRGIELYAPPLRARHEDIALLAQYFLEQLASRSHGSMKQLSAEAMQRLLNYHWPGNVRELQQVITAAGAMAAGVIIDAAELALQDTASGAMAAITGMPALAGLPLNTAKAQLVEWFERSRITAALATCDGNISAAARELGLHRQSLQQKMAQLGIAR